MSVAKIITLIPIEPTKFLTHFDISKSDLEQKFQGGGEQDPLEMFQNIFSIQSYEFPFLYLQGGINTSVKHGGIYIKSMVQGGAADRNGRIQIGKWNIYIEQNLLI